MTAVNDAKSNLLDELVAMNAAVKSFEEDILSERTTPQDKARRLQHAALQLKYQRMALTQSLLAARGKK